MAPLVWLLVAGLAGVGAYLVGWPAWTSVRERQARETNSERYLAWRGRATRGPVRRQEWTSAERGRLVAAAALGIGAVAALVAFFVAG